MKERYSIVGLGDYFGDKGPGVRETSETIEGLRSVEEIMSFNDDISVEEAVEELMMSSGDGQENFIIIKSHGPIEVV